MKREQIVKRIMEQPAGRFFRIRYMSQVRLTADAVKAGISVIKIVNTTSRTGINYKSLIEPETWKDVSDYEGINSNFSWIVRNKIKYNHSTQKEYLVLAPIQKGHHTTTQYILTDGEGNTRCVSKSDVEQYAIKSYWKVDCPKVINVTLDNILWI